MRAIRGTARLVYLLVVTLIVLGAAVRSTHSGLSCPDWPTCYGHWVPLPVDIPADTGYAYYQVMLEWVHRLLAGVVTGPLVLLLAILAWRRREELPGLGAGAVATVVLLLVQAALGGVTVLDQNSPWSVAVHLGTALLLLAAVLFLFELGKRRRFPGTEALRGPATVAWVAVLAAMVVAAVVAKTGASLACSTWPDCDGSWIPDLSEPDVHIHFAHRILALIALLAVTILFFAARRHEGARGTAGAALLLIIAAALLAGYGIAAEWPVWARVLHQALAVLTYLHVTIILWRSWIAGRVPVAGEVPA